jgi:hypothetical protein
MEICTNQKHFALVGVRGGEAAPHIFAVERHGYAAPLDSKSAICVA